MHVWIPQSIWGAMNGPVDIVVYSMAVAKIFPLNGVAVQGYDAAVNALRIFSFEAEICRVFQQRANGTAPWTPFWEIRIRPFIITSLGFRLVHHVQGLHSAVPASNLRPKASAVWLFGRCHILCVKWWRSKGNSYLLEGILFLKYDIRPLPFKAWKP